MFWQATGFFPAQRPSGWYRRPIQFALGKCIYSLNSAGGGWMSSIASAVNAPLDEEVVHKGPSHKTKKYPYIDALRGYAVLFVITCHTGGMFRNMPYPVKKLTNVGWHGVQLFFLISCVPLMMSWRSDERKGIASPQSFWARRFFRISPMYYLAALFYFFAEPPASGFDFGQMLASLVFVNAWHP